jgi:hypothetical protein
MRSGIFGLPPGLFLRYHVETVLAVSLLIRVTIHPNFHHKETKIMASIYVGNLPPSATEDKIRELFKPHGSIWSIKLVTDFEGAPSGFGFVEMNARGATVAIEAVNEAMLDGQSLRVDACRPRRGLGRGYLRRAR